MGFRILGNVSGNQAEVDSDNNLFVTLPQTTSLNVGLAGLASITHDGTSGVAKVVRRADVSTQHRLRIGVDSPIFNDDFSYGAQNSAIYQLPVTTMTVTFAGGYMVLNGGSSVASAAVARAATYKFFEQLPGAGMRLVIEGYWTQTPQTNNVMEMGWFQATGTAAPTDGVLFRMTGGGAWLGVVNYAGSETTVSLSSTPSAGTDHRFEIQFDDTSVNFWVDDVLQGSLAAPAGTNGPSQAAYQPITCRNYNSSTVSVAQQLKIGQISLTQRDYNTMRPWSLVQAGLGGHGSQGQAGQTVGTTALLSNSLAAAAGTAMTNTAVGPGTGLGGQFSVLPTLAAGTDGILCSYQVPAGSAANPGKSLVIKGVTINGIVTTIFAGGPVYYVFSLAYGHTAVSLATAEAAAAKASRRVPIGVGAFVVTAPVGQQMTPNPIQINFANEVVVHPGEFVAIAAKNIGTVTTTGAILFIIDIDSYFE